MKKPIIWIVGQSEFRWPDDLPAQVRKVSFPLPGLASLAAWCRPQACLCLDEALAGQLTGLPCPVWGLGFSGTEGCLDDNWPDFLAASQHPPDPGGWRSQIFLCVPFSYLWDDKQLFIREQVLSLKLNVELGLDGYALDQLLPLHLAAAQDLLAEHRLTIHMPFMDLHPGASDPRIGQASIERLQQAADIAIALKGQRAVFHLGYDSRLNRETAAFIELVSQRLAPVMRRLQRAACWPVLENVFEPDPAVLLAVRHRLARLTQEQVGICLDVGHAQAFNRTDLRQWWRACEPYIMELHLHDNPGHDDLHQAIGSGSVDYDFLGKAIKKLPAPPVYTLELRSEEALWQSLRALERLWGSAPGV